MNKLFPTALGLKVAIAISAGGVLVQHPLYTDPAPRAYSDITIAKPTTKRFHLRTRPGHDAPTSRYAGKSIDRRRSACC